MLFSLLLCGTLLVQQNSVVIAGPSSAYAPNDGHNSGNLACGGKFTAKQEHVALRRWRTYGCGSRVFLFSPSTMRWHYGTVMDGGPYGIVNKKGAWRVWTRPRPPKGWSWRGAVDMSIGMWKKMGRPRFLSRVYLLVMPARRAVPVLPALRKLLAYVVHEVVGCSFSFLQ